jgi:hypothetical protein
MAFDPPWSSARSFEQTTDAAHGAAERGELRTTGKTEPRGVASLGYHASRAAGLSTSLTIALSSEARFPAEISRIVNSLLYIR